MDQEYRICSRCIMDTTVPDITFDEKGVCNYCTQYHERAKKEVHYNTESGQRKLDKLVEAIKKEGKNKEYDCIIGLSGGVDSSMVAYTVKKLGLRPLGVHLDNGWNSEISVKNVENIVKKLGIDFYNYVIDWEEMKDLHLSFLKASIANSENPTDHGITAFLFRLADKKGIRFIITGSNIASEGILPASWMYDQLDWKHVKAIHKIFGTVKLKTFPHMSIFDLVYLVMIKRIIFLPILNYFPYNRKEAMQLLEKELGWNYYGMKHFESIYTRFFQAHILPKKFNIDKRKAHFSTLICSGQMTREEALQAMERDIYPAEQLEEDKKYVIKKLGITPDEFEKIMSEPVRNALDYPNNQFLFSTFSFFVKLAKKMATYNY